ncbi:uncharacterized protein EI90DRAFT_3021733 [Cantharellus anzutake]|uniref:uncharacterized protein n=1 Tax=Cantharellus anzutake TaxID=1750568 RepID=UPI00190815B8|nr:uncharacterized protein EI90DRAFT_3021733 [Cantharellus anzutake]KAF8315993.1 hypothetical protein EI90DRAFT_3021733 [Cantharellus anzutake]
MGSNQLIEGLGGLRLNGRLPPSDEDDVFKRFHQQHPNADTTKARVLLDLGCLIREYYPDYDEPDVDELKLLAEDYQIRSLARIESTSFRADGPRQSPPAGSRSDDCANHEAAAPVENWASVQSFVQPFVGEDHNALLKTMDEYVLVKDVYNFSMSVVQSSGCGKSRLVDKAAKERFAFSLNLRETLSGHLGTYPPSDEEVRDYLLPKGVDTSDDLVRRYLAFLIAMFDVAERIARPWGLSTHSEIASKWHNYLTKGRSMQDTGENRRNFYKDVIKEAKEFPLPGLGEPVAPGAASATWTQVVEERLVTSYGRLVKVLHPDPKCPPSGCAFFIYIDEAHTLTDHPPRRNNGRDRSAYHSLGTALTYLKTIPVFALFLSTNSKLKSLAPTMASHPSARVFGAQTILFPPYTELPFDIFTGASKGSKGLCDRLDAKDSSITLKEMCSTEMLARFGRPLWFSLYDNRRTKSENIFDFAMRKLDPKRATVALATGTHCEHSDKDGHAMIAALDIRIQLSYDLTREVARSMVSTLVESYMRVVYAVPKHRDCMYSGYPSEPVLAEAASRLLNQKRHDGLNNNLPPIAFEGPEILSNALGGNLLARGERGEVIGRLLMTIAHDTIIMHRNPSYGHTPDFHSAIRVLDFLKCLFADRFHNIILNALPVAGRSGARTLKAAYKDAYINFSHFVQIDRENDHHIDIQYVCKLMLRGAAVNCAGTQRAVDLIIPVFFGDPVKDAICCDRTSVLQVQIKNRESIKNGHIDPKISNPPPGTPIISLFLELGSDMPSNEQNVSVQSGQRKPHNQSREDDHYFILAKGCTAKTYSVIPPEYNARYASLLQATTLAAEIPREGNAALARRQKALFKPTWKESWDW